MDRTILCRKKIKEKKIEKKKRGKESNNSAEVETKAWGNERTKRI